MIKKKREKTAHSRQPQNRVTALVSAMVPTIPDIPFLNFFLREFVLVTYERHTGLRRAWMGGPGGDPRGSSQLFPAASFMLLQHRAVT